MRRKSGQGMRIYYKNFTIRYSDRKKKRRKRKVMNEIDWSQLVIIKLTTYLKKKTCTQKCSSIILLSAR
jgi:hypothetical protein